jgi:3-oxoadipate enol-lactonase
MPKIKVNNVNLYYKTYGQGQPLIFVTGFSGDHTIWNNIISAYSDKYQVIIFDNVGSGKSDCPDWPYTAEMMADDLAGLMRALNIGPAHVVGASFGGVIVQYFAHKYPKLIKSAVLACSLSKPNARVNLYADGRFELIKANAPNSAIIRFITLICWSANYLNTPGTAEKLVQLGFTPITTKGYELQLGALKTVDSSKFLNQLKCPFLVLVGDDDVFINVDEGEYLRDTIPGAEFYCFKNVGHLPHFEQPEVFNKLVLDFIAKK